MSKHCKAISAILFFVMSVRVAGAQDNTDTLVIRDLNWNSEAPAGLTELNIPSSKSLLQAFIYRANGSNLHPTLIMLHGFPGNEKNLDLAQLVRARGWNVVYFDYRGSWGSQGKFSFKHCVEDVVNVVAFCRKQALTLRIDTSNLVLFGHSMGGWVCLKAIQYLPNVSKAFALSTWDIAGDFKNLHSESARQQAIKSSGNNFVLNTSPSDIFAPVFKDPVWFELRNDTTKLAGKKIIMLDEHRNNRELAASLQNANQVFFQYDVWPTDHPFTNKRISLFKKLMNFLEQ